MIYIYPTVLYGFSYKLLMSYSCSKIRKKSIKSDLKSYHRKLHWKFAKHTIVTSTCDNYFFIFQVMFAFNKRFKSTVRFVQYSTQYGAVFHNGTTNVPLARSSQNFLMTLLAMHGGGTNQLHSYDEFCMNAFIASVPLRKHFEFAIIICS